MGLIFIYNEGQVLLTEPAHAFLLSLFQFPYQLEQKPRIQEVNTDFKLAVNEILGLLCGEGYFNQSGLFDVYGRDSHRLQSCHANRNDQRYVLPGKRDGLK